MHKFSLIKTIKKQHIKYFLAIEPFVANNKIPLLNPNPVVQLFPPWKLCADARVLTNSERQVCFKFAAFPGTIQDAEMAWDQDYVKHCHVYTHVSLLGCSDCHLKPCFMFLHHIKDGGCWCALTFPLADQTLGHETPSPEPMVLTLQAMPEDNFMQAGLDCFKLTPAFCGFWLLTLSMTVILVFDWLWFF